MENYKPLALLGAIYLTTVIVGLNVGATLLPQMYPPAGVQPTVQPAVPNPDSVWASFQVFGYVLAATALMLVLLKFARGIIIRLLMVFAFFVGLTISLSSFIGGLGVPAALLLITLFYLRKNSLLLTNLTLVFAIAGIGGWLGASLSALPSIILLIVLAVYDIVAVFGTKHMVTIAKESKDKLPLMFLVPYGDRNLGIGTGDMAIPLTFTTSILKDYGAGYAIPTALGGLLGLVWLFYYVEGRKKVVLPALPPIAAGLILAYGLCLLAFGFV